MVIFYHTNTHVKTGQNLGPKMSQSQNINSPPTHTHTHTHTPTSSALIMVSRNFKQLVGWRKICSLKLQMTCFLWVKHSFSVIKSFYLNRNEKKKTKWWKNTNIRYHRHPPPIYKSLKNQTQSTCARFDTFIHGRHFKSNSKKEELVTLRNTTDGFNRLD